MSKHTDDLRHQLAEVQAIANTIATNQAKLNADAAALAERVARLAKGTGDVTDAAALAVAAAKPTTPEDRVVAVLGERVAGVDDLVAATGLKQAQVNLVAARLAVKGRAYNLGSESRPRWTLVVGDDTTTDVLAEACARCLRERPMELLELASATGGRRNRVSGILTRLEGVQNLGTGTRARWFLATPLRRR